MITRIQATRHIDFYKIRDQQPYAVTLLDIPLVIEKDVFPPDVGATTRYLASEISKYNNSHTALDMGCGSGFLALYMRKCGIPYVWAADIHLPAVNCARYNLRRNAHLSPITILQSDLFASFKTKMKFDLIVFNHPYYPTIGQPVFGDNPDGGKEIIKNFFSTINDYIHKHSIILMPFSSSLTEDEHDPWHIGAIFPFLSFENAACFEDKNGMHKIYKITNLGLENNA